MAYGTLVHELLEVLPNSQPNYWTEIASRILKISSLDKELKIKAEKEAREVLETQNLIHIFAPTSLAEVPISADIGSYRMRGMIDRLIVKDGHVQIIDFKTNRQVPTSPEQCPEGVLRQMGAYALAVQNIYPDHKIESFILWTKIKDVMQLPHNIVTDAISRSQYLDVKRTDS